MSLSDRRVSVTTLESFCNARPELISQIDRIRRVGAAVLNRHVDGESIRYEEGLQCVLGSNQRLVLLPIDDDDCSRGTFKICQYAWDPSANRIIAGLSYINHESGVAENKFRTELAAYQAIQNVPNVVQYLGSVTSGNRRLIFVEYCPNGDLFRLIETRPLALRNGLEKMIPVAEAIAALHRQGMAHRDLKPENILVTPDGARITDFDTLIRVEAGDREIVGTPLYFAPELRAAAGRAASYDWQAIDMWNLGLILLEVYGSSFAVSEIDLIVSGSMSDETKSRDICSVISKVLPGLDGSVISLIKELLSLNPAQRPKADHALAMLQAVQPRADRGPSVSLWRRIQTAVPSAIASLLGQFMHR